MPPQRESSVGLKLAQSVSYLEKVLKGRPKPRVALILGTGLGPFAFELEEAVQIPYADMPYFPPVKADSHAGILWHGRIGKTWVVCMQGRAHYYEGWTMEELVHPVRTMIKFGAKIFIATNATGSLNLNYESGTLSVIRSHINLMGSNPLLGPNPTDDTGKELGVRFLDMASAYSPKLVKYAQGCACDLRQQLPMGVLVSVSGPSYETGPQTAMLQGVADFVGMSVVHEIEAAHHMGAVTGGFSLITNFAGGISPFRLTSDHVAAVANEAKGRFIPLMLELIDGMPPPSELRPRRR